MKRRKFAAYVGIGTAASTLAACLRNTAPPETLPSLPQFDRSVRADGFQAIGTVEQLERDGKVLDRIARAIAIREPERGELVAFSSRCTHQACGVDWNEDERQFACPCHGSRFSPGGNVERGPAVVELARYPVKIDGDLVFVNVTDTPKFKSSAPETV